MDTYVYDNGNLIKQPESSEIKFDNGKICLPSCHQVVFDNELSLNLEGGSTPWRSEVVANPSIHAKICRMAKGDKIYVKIGIEEGPWWLVILDDFLQEIESLTT